MRQVVRGWIIGILLVSVQNGGHGSALSVQVSAVVQNPTVQLIMGNAFLHAFAARKIGSYLEASPWVQTFREEKNAILEKGPLLPLILGVVNGTFLSALTMHYGSNSRDTMPLVTEWAAIAVWFCALRNAFLVGEANPLWSCPLQSILPGIVGFCSAGAACFFKQYGLKTLLGWGALSVSLATANIWRKINQIYPFALECCKTMPLPLEARQQSVTIGTETFNRDQRLSLQDGIEKVMGMNQQQFPIFAPLRSARIQREIYQALKTAKDSRLLACGNDEQARKLVTDVHLTLAYWLRRPDIILQTRPCNSFIGEYIYQRIFG